MGCQHVDHKHIAEFDQGRVNLPRDKAKEYRAQNIHLLVRVTQFCHWGFCTVRFSLRSQAFASHGLRG